MMLAVNNWFLRSDDVLQTNEIRGFKVTNTSRTKKIGIACRSLEELKVKACAKLKITEKIENISVFLLDGSEIDEEYFLTLKPQTTLIVQKPGEKVISDADLLYETLRRVNIEFLTAGEEISKFLTENLKTKIAVLNCVLNKDDSKTHLSSRNNHPEWFSGLGSTFTTKEAYMHRRCQDRMRGYLFKAVEQIKSSEIFNTDRRARQHLLRAIAFFKLQLKEDHYHGHYFDRSKVQRIKPDNDETDKVDSASDSCYDHCPCKLKISDYLGLFVSEEDQVDAKRVKQLEEENIDWHYKVTPSKERKLIILCNEEGEFKCDGVWNKEKCMYDGKHRINPYRSKEELILFSTWNLDHRIERSRTLVPKLLLLSQEETLSENDVIEMYENLFTVKNLRLVHIVCHDKSAHN